MGIETQWNLDKTRDLEVLLREIHTRPFNIQTESYSGISVLGTSDYIPSVAESSQSSIG